MFFLNLGYFFFFCNWCIRCLDLTLLYLYGVHTAICVLIFILETSACLLKCLFPLCKRGTGKSEIYLAISSHLPDRV